MLSLSPYGGSSFLPQSKPMQVRFRVVALHWTADWSRLQPGSADSNNPECRTVSFESVLVKRQNLLINKRKKNLTGVCANCVLEIVTKSNQSRQNYKTGFKNCAKKINHQECSLN